MLDQMIPFHPECKPNLKIGQEVWTFIGYRAAIIRHYVTGYKCEVAPENFKATGQITFGGNNDGMKIWKEDGKGNRLPEDTYPMDDLFIYCTGYTLYPERREDDEINDGRGRHIIYDDFEWAKKDAKWIEVKATDEDYLKAIGVKREWHKYSPESHKLVQNYEDREAEYLESQDLMHNSDLRKPGPMSAEICRSILADCQYYGGLCYRHAEYLEDYLKEYLPYVNLKKGSSLRKILEQLPINIKQRRK